MDDPVSLFSSIPFITVLGSTVFVDVIGITLMLILSAFFSGMEIAFISVNKLRVELDSNQGIKSAKILSNHLSRPSMFISTTLVGNNIALVVYGILMGDVLETLFREFISGDFMRFVTVTILSTMVVLITAEFLPKTLFRINPNKVLQGLIYPFQFVFFLFKPIVWIIHKLSSLILKLFSGESLEEENVFTKVDLGQIVNEYENIDSSEEMDLDTEVFRNALDFSEVILRECMVPRMDIVAIDINESIEKALDLMVDSGYSKLLLFQSSIDNIIGYLHRTDFFSNPKSLKEIKREIIVSSESMSAKELLSEFISKHKSIAVVVDEYGGTAGIVTMEDLIEEIFGEIEDEHDKEDLKEVVVKDREFIFSARQEVDYLNDTYNLKIPEGDYETLGGYIIFLYESIPALGTVIQENNLQFVISNVENSRILEVEVKVLD